MRQHSQLYRGLDLNTQSTYDSKAEEVYRQRLATWQEALNTLDEQIKLARNRYEALLGEAPANLVSEHRLTRDDLGQLAHMYNSAHYAPNVVVGRVGDWITPPCQPPVGIIDTLDSFETSARHNNKPAELWQRVFCQNRSEVRGTAIGKTLEDGSTWYLFIHATQAPLEAWFLPLKLDYFPVPALAGMTEGERALLTEHHYNQRFHAVDGKYIRHDAIVDLPVDTCFVVEHLFFSSGGLVLGRSVPIPMLDWLCFWPVPDAGLPKDPVPKASKGEVCELLEKHPWAKEYLRPAGPPDKKNDGVDSCGPSVHPEVHDALAAAWATFGSELSQGVHTASSGDDFFVRVRHVNGRQTVGAEAKRGLAREWCHIFSLQVSTTYYSSLIDPGVASAFASRWCEVMQHFYDIWRERNDPHYRYSNDELVQPQGSDEWLALHLDDYAALRAADLNLTAPRNPQ